MIYEVFQFIGRTWLWWLVIFGLGRAWRWYSVHAAHITLTEANGVWLMTVRYGIFGREDYVLGKANKQDVWINTRSGKLICSEWHERAYHLSLADKQIAKLQS